MSTSPLPIRIESLPGFFGLSRLALARRLESLGLPRYRADQIYTWVYQKHHRGAAAMTNLPAGLRARLEEVCDLSLPRVASTHVTRDHLTHKFVLELSDGARVECVSMRTERRLTFCLSSQVGCALKCSFCATGLMGLSRNLRAEEIVAQVVLMGDFHAWRDDRFNLVFMGMGEPLANYRAVMDAIRILHEPLGLAVSLHATTDELRDQLVPVNQRWPIAELLAAARDYGRASGRRVTLEYTLLGGVNDRDEDADRLGAIARDLPSKINLIPYNPVPGLPWRRPAPEAVAAFAERLYPRAPAVMIRHTLGGEIWAACGQLGGLGPGA